MKVVQVSNTPVAGNPGNIVSALNRLTDIRARHTMAPPEGLPVVVFSPNGRASTWKTRWETKGAPQAMGLMHKLEHRPSV